MVMFDTLNPKHMPRERNYLDAMLREADMRAFELRPLHMILGDMLAVYESRIRTELIYSLEVWHSRKVNPEEIHIRLTSGRRSVLVDVMFEDFTAQSFIGCGVYAARRAEHQAEG